ncbi:MAG: DUF2975 domain-containing protein [Bryobacteraceae bacterium]|nr:DUF2975 domain-containing protein [Bryobacteraceae bacterium]
MSTTAQTALPLARFALKTTILVNWLTAAALVTLLLFLPHEQWILKSFQLAPSPAADRLVLGLRAIAGIGLASVPLNYVVLKRLLAMVESVRAGEPFAYANVLRLRAIAWALLGLQVFSLSIGAIARSISTPQHVVKLDAGFSASGWLAVLLTFILARVFSEAARMRDDLEGTV